MAGRPLSAEECDRLWRAWTPAEVAVLVRRGRVGARPFPRWPRAGALRSRNRRSPRSIRRDRRCVSRVHMGRRRRRAGLDLPRCGGQPPSDLAARPGDRALSPRRVPRAAGRRSLGVPPRRLDHPALRRADIADRRRHSLRDPRGRAPVQGEIPASERRGGLSPRSSRTERSTANAAVRLAVSGAPRPSLGGRLRRVAVLSLNGTERVDDALPRALRIGEHGPTGDHPTPVDRGSAAEERTPELGEAGGISGGDYYTVDPNFPHPTPPGSIRAEHNS